MNVLDQLIKQINSNKSYPAIDIVKPNPNIAALLSKLILSKDKTKTVNIRNPNNITGLNNGQMTAISDSIKNRIKDNTNITMLFPDIELAIQILISSILSPKDMVKTDVIYSSTNDFLPTEITLKLTSIIEEELNTHYKLKSELPKILRSTLFESGSYIKIILPESTLDGIINNSISISTESINSSLRELHTPSNGIKSIGILGNYGDTKQVTSLESFTNGQPISNYNSDIGMMVKDRITYPLQNTLEVTDNYNLLKLPLVTESLGKQRINSVVGSKISLESKINENALFHKLYKDNSDKYQNVVVIPSNDNIKRKSVGRPLTFKLPSESVIPVYVPGAPEKHIGYFVLIDGDGNPVTLSTDPNADQGLLGLQNNTANNSTLSSMLINKAKKNLTATETIPSISNILAIYTGIVEQDLMSRLKNGLYRKELSIANNEEIYRIMLSRALANKFTRLVYVPSELISYFAFKYFDNGVGKSYLDDIKILTSLRAILLFAKIMGQAKNAIDTTHVNMTLDEHDPDPQKTIEEAINEIVRVRQQYFPLGLNNAPDLLDWIQRIGLEFTFEGHPGLPDTKFEFETKQNNHTVPDSALDEDLRKHTFMAFGLNPEVIDSANNAEFATTIVANNVLLSKIVLQLQEILSEQVTNHGRQIVSNDQEIIDKLLDIIISNKSSIEKVIPDDDQELYKTNPASYISELITRYINTIQIKFPSPDVTSITNQSDAYTSYQEALDKALDAWLSSDSMTTDIAGDISGSIDSIKAVLKSYFLRKWMANSGFMTELNDIVTTNEDGSPVLDIYEMNAAHIESLTNSSLKLLDIIKKNKEKANDKLGKLGINGSSSDTSDEPSDNEFNDTDESNPDDLGISDTLEDENPEEESLDKKDSGKEELEDASE